MAVTDRVTDAPRTWETPRLLARPAVREAAAAIFEAYARDPDVARYVIWRPHRDVSETVAFLERCEAAWRDGTSCAWTLWMKETGTLAGMVEARVNPPAVNLGYVLWRALWRHGLMTEAVRAVVAWALARPDIYRVCATCDVDNVASARLLEAVGMQREGGLRRRATRCATPS
jgi:RimJ/RimL family protein N-acetyltransferase